MVLFLEDRDFELAVQFNGGMIQWNIAAEDFRNGGFLEDRLPWAFRLAGAAIDALVRVDVELIGEGFPVVTDVFVNAINRTNTNASSIKTVTAKAGDSPRHLVIDTSRATAKRSSPIQALRTASPLISAIDLEQASVRFAGSGRRASVQQLIKAE